MDGVSVQIVALDDLPGVRAAAEASGERFNISHSGDLAAVAVAVAVAPVRVGVDIERINPRRPWQRLGERCGWEVASAEEFYERWTEYEAYAKALRLGLALNPRDMDLEGWRMERLAMPPGYAGCVVAEA